MKTRLGFPSVQPTEPAGAEDIRDRSTVPAPEPEPERGNEPRQSGERASGERKRSGVLSPAPPRKKSATYSINEPGFDDHVEMPKQRPARASSQKVRRGDHAADQQTPDEGDDVHVRRTARVRRATP